MSEKILQPQRELVWLSETQDKQPAMLYHRRSLDGSLNVELTVGPVSRTYRDEELAQLGSGSLKTGVELLTKTVETVHDFDWQGQRLFDQEATLPDEVALVA